MTEENRISPIEQDALFREIGSALLDAVAGEWEEIRFNYRGLISISTARLEAVRPGGEVERVRPPRDASKLMRELRSGMYQTGKGAWYTALYVITPPGRYNVDFDYDNEPRFDVPPAAESFALDLEHFPREEHNIPDWLRAKLAEARQEGGEG
ncbi:hypothetical protein DPM19_22020 [Actinomadura craniellae]|uniref:Agglutinin cell wall attachment protein n=1 Tax=Actinomadura craniellae TaxID=2231787 RepID=A0A365H298_9ACTN|nr:hypothetical protein [Actinomadura craniellae]RAY13169.1 hypothetical protein DPM19_22020 [Actinomadura craniellae]